MLHSISLRLRVLTLVLLVLLCLLISVTRAAPLGGTVDPLKAIIGSSANDLIGFGGVIQLPSGNVVISSPFWNGSQGAVTCLTPAQLRAGNITISASNSVVGSSQGDQIGFSGVRVLTNGNYVIGSILWKNVAADAVAAGAATWVNGTTCIPHNESTPGAVVSATNSLVSDVTANTGQNIVALKNGNYVVVSNWNNGGAYGAGAVTWGNGTTGTHGVVSTSNSLVGTQSNDHVGDSGILPLSNGNYVVISQLWDNPTTSAINAGAVTWANGNGGTIGAVSDTNSLIGTSTNDGSNMGVTQLSNGNYVVLDSGWDNGAVSNAGSVTWGSGNAPTSGVISSSNSLVGSSTTDGSNSVVKSLGNGQYVVAFPYWDNTAAGIADAGMVRLVDGSMGISGVIDSSNGLIGSTTGDNLGSGGIVVLPGSNYVVISPLWSNSGMDNAGAVTWANGNTGISGQVTPANSLVGSTANDFVGNPGGANPGVIVLTNGNYVVLSALWDNLPATDVGAVTWANGNGSTVGVISPANSLIGSTSGDQVGRFSAANGGSTVALSNGNYVVASPSWDNNGVVDAGAVTWANGNGGTVGTVTAANSLVGSTTNDQVGKGTVTVLPSSNYVVHSSLWGANDVGAVTWSNGSVVGAVSAANSLVGSTANDRVGYSASTVLTNGNYVVNSPYWNNNSGAATWGSGTTGITGVVSSTNSLTNIMSSNAGTFNIIPLTNGHYVVSSLFWSSGATNYVGMAAWGNGTTGTVGIVSSANALVGSKASDYIGMSVLALSNGDYIVSSYHWDNGGMTDVGIVIWGDGQPAGVMVSESGGTAVTEGGTTDSYTVVLNSPPTNNVTITLAFGADLNVTSGTTLTFTPANWNTPQTVTVAAVDDNTLEGTEIATITHLVSSLDLRYHAIAVSDVSVTITDNDSAPTATFTSQPSTITPEPFTVTPDPATNTPTPLPQGSVELLANGGFEIAGASAGKPESWTLKKLSQDKRKCDTVTTIISFQGRCAFIFRGAVGENAKLVQNANLSGYIFEEGDTLTYSIEYRTKGTSAPKLKLKLAVVFGDPLHPVKRSVTANIVNGVYSFVMTDYWFGADASTVTSIKAVIQNKTLTGKVFIDDASVVFDPLDDDPQN